MKRRQAIVAGLVVGVLASAGVMAAAAGKAPVRGHARPVGPALAPDTGAGELLIAVVGGVFASREEAEAANETLVFGDLQGYYVVPVAQFQGFRQQVGEPGDFALVSAFRTEEGAREFADLAASFGNAGGDPARAGAEPRRPLRGSGSGGGPGRHGSPARSGGGVAPVTAVRNAAAFVSSVLTLVACGGGAATQTSPTADRTACEVRFVTPEGFERTETFEEPYPDRVGVRLGWVDDEGRELHAFAGIPGEFGEGLPDAGTVELAAGGTGRLAGGVHEVWVLSWNEGGTCDPRVILGRGLDRRGFLELLRRAGVAAP